MYMNTQKHIYTHKFCHVCGVPCPSF